MFGRIAGRYDLLNHLLSGNVDKRWRRLVARTLRPSLVEGARALDVACGTGDLALALASAGEGDALRLPFADESFDVVTIAFGLRNLAGVGEGLRELLRVLRPGGRAAVLEFSSPVVPGFSALFRFYFARVLPRVGGWLSGSRGAYEYLPDSVSRFPDQERLAGLMRGIGFEEAGYRN